MLLRSSKQELWTILLEVPSYLILRVVGTERWEQKGGSVLRRTSCSLHLRKSGPNRLHFPPALLPRLLSLWFHSFVSLSAVGSEGEVMLKNCAWDQGHLESSISEWVEPCPPLHRTVSHCARIWISIWRPQSHICPSPETNPLPEEAGCVKCS